MIVIDDTNFHNAYARAVRQVLRNGTTLKIGTKEEPKQILDTPAIIELKGNAIVQIEDRELHPQFPFRFVDQYCEEFTYEFQKKYLNANKDTLKFSYTYFDRLVNYMTKPGIVNQLEELNNCLRIQTQTNNPSNRCQAITWQPFRDCRAGSPPCLQRLWIRYAGDNKVSVHFHWRSRDLYTAWQANLIALIDMLNSEVIRPNQCKIHNIVDFNDSLHIYTSDMDAATKVKLVPQNPFER